MKPSTILRNAAVRIANATSRRGCCGAVLYVTRNDIWATAAHVAYTCLELFNPNDGRVYWFGNRFDRPEQLNRYVALSLAAEIALSEGN